MAKLRRVAALILQGYAAIAVGSQALAQGPVGRSAITPVAVGAETKDCRGGLKLFPDDRAQIDPELLNVLATMRPTGEQAGPPTIEGARARFLEGYREREKSAPAAVTGVSREEVRIPGEGASAPIRLLIYRPDRKGSFRPALLDFHGGAFILGFPEMNDRRNRMLAKDLDAVVVSVDYRLAPENKFPAGLNDGYAALSWLHDNASKLGVDPARIAISGDSAGGGIAAGLALMARDKGKIPIKAQILIYPNVDDRPFTSADPTCAPGTAMLPNVAAMLYLGRPAVGEVPVYAFPARASSLAHLPPTFIAVGAVDGLAGQDIDFAQRLIWESVPTELHVYPGAFHGFDLEPRARVTQRFYQDLKLALSKAWATAGSDQADGK